jgi:hypothetical protein
VTMTAEDGIAMAHAITTAVIVPLICRLGAFYGVSKFY